MILRTGKSVVIATLVGITSACGGASDSSTVEARSSTSPEVFARVERYEEPYDGVDQLIATSTLIVVGSVANVEPIKTPPNDDPDPAVSEFFDVVVDVKKVLKVDSEQRVKIVWEGFIRPQKESPPAPVIVNGIAMPTAQDRVVLFLRPQGEKRRAYFGSEYAYTTNSLDGILMVTADHLETSLEGSGRPAHLLAGMTVDELAELVAVSRGE